jgi:hypothetical protein
MESLHSRRLETDFLADYLRQIREHSLVLSSYRECLEIA